MHSSAFLWFRGSHSTLGEHSFQSIIHRTIFKLIIQNIGSGNRPEINLIWMSQNLSSELWTLVNAMSWTHVDPDLCRRMASLGHYTYIYVLVCVCVCLQMLFTIYITLKITGMLYQMCTTWVHMTKTIRWLSMQILPSFWITATKRQYNRRFKHPGPGIIHQVPQRVNTVSWIIITQLLCVHNPRRRR